MKLKKKAKIILFIFFLVLLGGVIYYFFFYNNRSIKKSVVLTKINDYGYVLKDSKNNAYQKEFKNLEKILKEKKVDEKKYAKSISKLFVIDFYSLDDKKAKTDVGGVDFVNDNAKVDFLEKAENTYYKYLESNLYGDRKTKLPEVSKVKVLDVENTAFTYNETSDTEGYKVHLTWEYKNDSSFKNYQHESYLTLVHDGKKLTIVELSKEGDLDEE